MKKLLMIISLFLVLVTVSSPEAQAQGAFVKYGDSTDYQLEGSDFVIKTYPPSFFHGATVFTVGALFEKGASEDSLAAIRVYHGLTAAALAVADTAGNELTNNNIRFTNNSQHEYHEQTFTVSGGINYVKIYLDKVGHIPGLQYSKALD